MKTCLSLILFLTFTVSFSRARAQTATAAAPVYTASHLKAAERLFNANNVWVNMNKAFDLIITSQSQRLPEAQRVAFAIAMRKFINKYITEIEVRKAFLPMYASAFSEDELNKIADFLSTDAGKKMG